MHENSQKALRVGAHIPDAAHLAHHVVGGTRKEDREAHHPVAQNGLYQGLAEGRTALVEGAV